MTSETSKYRHLTEKYCQGCGVDIGSGGDPVVPHAISVDLPDSQFKTYNGNTETLHPIHIRGDAFALPFMDGTLDFCYSSHLLEDFLDWRPALSEWIRILKPGGRLVVLIPDKERWAKAVANGQPPNDAHCHEGRVGELTQAVSELGRQVDDRTMRVVEDRLTDLDDADYSILFVAIKE